VLHRAFGLSNEEAIEEWIKLTNEESHNCYLSTGVITANSLRKMK
jgi:hypothetical protein